MPTSYVMKVSSNGGVSIPAQARARWGSDHLVVVDLVDRIVDAAPTARSGQRAARQVPRSGTEYD